MCANQYDDGNDYTLFVCASDAQLFTRIECANDKMFQHDKHNFRWSNSIYSHLGWQRPSLSQKWTWNSTEWISFYSFHPNTTNYLATAISQHLLIWFYFRVLLQWNHFSIRSPLIWPFWLDKRYNFTVPWEVIQRRRWFGQKVKSLVFIRM